VDNAIGCAGLLEISRVLSELVEAPRRSVLIVFTTAEEEGNLGAQYFLDHPPIPVTDMVANVNIDGLAFLEEFEDVVGIGAELSDLGAMLERTAALSGLGVSSPKELVLGQEVFARSEQAVFAEAGIPSLLVTEGLNWSTTSGEQALERVLAWMSGRYHTPHDDLAQPLHFGAARNHAALLLAVVVSVADAPLAPQWRPGVPYAYERLLRLAAEEAGSRSRSP
jgi:Zn-dependent M28 family amino/carboxypeptidase